MDKNKFLEASSPLVSRVPDSLAVRRESGQIVSLVPRPSYHGVPIILEKWFPLQDERGHSSYCRSFKKQNREEGETE